MVDVPNRPEYQSDLFKAGLKVRREVLGGDYVDRRGALRSVDGGWIADASVMPTLIGGNTNAPILMMAEKAAQWMKEAHA